MNYLIHHVGDDELEHYGRLGMKWGKSIYGKEKAFAKATKKLTKLTNRATTRATRSAIEKSRSDNYRERNQFVKDKFIRFPVVDRMRSRRLANRANRYARQSYRNLRASQRAQRKAQKFVNSMNKEFSDMKLTSMSTQDIELSRKYVISAFEDYKKKN